MFMRHTKQHRQNSAREVVKIPISNKWYNFADAVTEETVAQASTL